MDFATVLAIIIIFMVSLFVIGKVIFSVNWQKKFHHPQAELIKTLLTLDETTLNELFRLYQKEFGAGAGRYARKTYQKWKEGQVRPNNQTFRRFLVHLPKVMSYDLKCEVLRRFMEEHCSKENYELTVYTDNWEESLTPLVREIIDRPYTAQLPKNIEEKLQWLSEGEMQVAQSILKQSQIEEGKIAVSMLRQEFADIENLLAETADRSKVTHTLKFPYGTITLRIKRR